MQNQQNNLVTPQPVCELVHTLQQRIAQIESNRRHSTGAPISSGCQPMDRLLPEHGFRRGTLVEYLSAGSGTGATTLAMIAAAQACAEGGICVVLDPTGEFYPPAAARIGMALDQLIVVRSTGCADHDWAMDQALRCRAVAAVLAWPEMTESKYVPTLARMGGGEDRRPIACSSLLRPVRFPAVSLEPIPEPNAHPRSKRLQRVWGHGLRSFRRWQLAVEEGRGLGLFLRPDAVRQTPSWADVRLLVEPLPTPDGLAGRRLRIQVLRCRGSAGGGSIEVEIDDEAHTVHPIARLAPAAAPRGAVGA